ncbi:MAG: B12-binding domain-containing radical SAM protein [Planctomycetaceae bacterium]|nr:B12-binding domain-containing radical SAM protein [Planctomycetaceae bacterium]
MKVALIFTPNKLNPNFRDLAFRDDNIGFIPPLSLLSVAAILEASGAEVLVLDMEAQRLTLDAAVERLKAFSPDLLGFTLSTYSFRPILEWIRLFKQATGLPVIVGGAHAALYPAQTMTHPEIDYLIVGEAEIPLPQFIDALRHGRSLDGIKSLAFRRNGQVVLDATRQYVGDIDEIPWAARHLIDNTLYSNIMTRKRNFTAMLSTRGCPYRCAFCDQKTPKYRTRGPRSFVDEVVFNYRRHGIREFDVYDSTFTANRKRVMEICDLLAREKLDISWTVRSRVDSVTREMLEALKRAGCHTLMYGIESSDREILKAMNKDISPERVREMVSYSHKLGFNVLGFFLFGFPGETARTIEDTIDFSLTLALDYAQFTVLVPFPDTQVYDYYRQHGLEDYWADYTVDPTRERKIELIGTEVTRDQASEYLGKAYRRFYFRPRVIIRRAIKMRSLGELKRMAGGAMGILKNAFASKDAP